jgi:DNA-binding SARP family transcriptional activator
VIDRARERAPALWLSSPGGSGKTVLVSSYLRQRDLSCLWFQMDEGDADLSGFFYYLSQAAPARSNPLPLFTAELQQNPRVFTHRFFEKLAARLKQPSIIVFDNCETADESPGLLEALAECVQALPDSVGLMFISRHDLPKELARLRISGKIVPIGWEEMKLSASETEEVAAARGRSRIEAGRLHEQAGGWMAALVMMLEQARLGGELTIEAPASRQALFDFFSQEIFGRMPEETQRLLMRTAFLPGITPEAGERLTGNPGAGRLLAAISRRNFFTERLAGTAPVYQYHPLFRQFLTQRCTVSFSPSQLGEIKRLSAAILAEGGEFSAAVRLLAEVNDYTRAQELLLENAYPLISQGRNRTFLELMELLPEEVNAKIPWSGFWQGLATQPYDPPKARAFFTKAFRGFEEGGDLAGMLRCWSSLAETVFHEWNDFTLLDPWIAWLDETSRGEFVIADPVLNLQVSSAMTAALTMRGGDPKKMRIWAARAILALQPVQDHSARASALIYCVNYLSWVRPLDLDTGIVETSLREAEQAELPPILRLATIYTRAALEIQRTPDMKGVLADVHRALALAEETGVHVWDEIFFGMGVYCSVVLGDRAASAAFLEKMRFCTSTARKQGLAFYYYIRAWDRLAFAAPGEAREEIGKALSLYAQTGYEFPSNVATYGAAVICAENGELNEALAYANQADAVAEKYETFSMRYTTLLVLAYVRLKRGERREALAAVAEALRIGRAGRFFQTTWWWHGPMMSALMELAVSENIERDYAVELVRRLKIPPADPHNAPESWPWPIRIHMLGGLEILVAGEPLDQGRKSQQKPLTLLKILVASESAGVSPDRLADLLWPDAEGDKAYHALEMAIYRTRKLLGRDEALQMVGGLLRLNRSLVLVDTQVFTERIDAGIELLEKGRPEEAEAALAGALPLYRGHLLGSGRGRDEEWAISARQCLRLKYLTGVEKLGDLQERMGVDGRTLDLYRRAMEMDELSEELCRRYMRCCLRLGRRSEAISAFQRLERNLRVMLNLTPPPELRNLLSQPAV